MIGLAVMCCALKYELASTWDWAGMINGIGGSLGILRALCLFSGRTSLGGIVMISAMG